MLIEVITSAVYLLVSVAIGTFLGVVERKEPVPPYLYKRWRQIRWAAILLWPGIVIMIGVLLLAT